MSIVQQPTRGDHILDRVYVSMPCYSTVRVVMSVVKSDHKAVVVYADPTQCRPVAKTRTKRSYRRRTPAQNAIFLQQAAALDFDFVTDFTDVQSQFDAFYTAACDLLDTYYPERTITVTSRDPSFLTGHIKAMLRRKNRLMRRGRTEEASALAHRVSLEITRRTKNRLSLLRENVDSRDIWSAVRQLTGKNKQHENRVEGISAQSLNDHYCKISTDTSYSEPARKSTANNMDIEWITEEQVFHMLDTLRPTATGLDNLPAWFLRLAAPIFCKPISQLFNNSLAASTVPSQWKRAWIKPVPKVPTPSQHVDFRPISITPVLTRMMEKSVVRQFVYPAFSNPPATLSFEDQYAYRPTGSTTAAIISILHQVTNLLLSHDYVILISLDFSKAFDTVRHRTLLDKMAEIDIPDYVYNWMVHFFQGHAHQTKFNGVESEFARISASIMQGSAIGPASYVVNASDLRAIRNGNELRKYADDTYLIVPAANVTTRSLELQHIQNWAAANNLRLNLTKSREIVFVDKRRHAKSPDVVEIPSLERVHQIKILGVTVTNSLSFSVHVHNIISSSSQLLYALRVLRTQGMCNSVLQTVFRAVVLSRLLYASSAWNGFLSARDRQKIEAFILKCTRAGYCSADLQDLEVLFTGSDTQLFTQILRNPLHVLHHLLPPSSSASQNYFLRPRTHNRQLPARSSSLTDSNFIIRMLYYNVY